MLEHLYEINRVLLSISSLIQESKGAKTNYVIEDLRKLAIYAMASNTESSIDECLRLGIIEKRLNRFLITKKGHKFFNLRTIKDDRTNIDLNQKQKEYLIQLLFESSFYRNELQKILTSLKLDYKRKVWFYNSNLPKENWQKDITNLMFQSDFLITKKNRIEVAKSGSYYISKIRHKVARSEETLLKLLETQRRIGNIAEQLTMNYEKKRLTEEGFPDLVLVVQCISKEDVFAGFDILSFNGKGSTLQHDRFIEVKGTSGIEPIFYWSKNEIEKAKELGKKYWIYLWTEIRPNMNGILCRAIQDPYSTLFSRKKEKPEPVLFMVEL